MRRSILLTIISVATFAFAACTPETVPVKNTPTPTPVATPAASPVGSPSPTGSPAADDKAPVAKADSLAGRWQGAEGTFLNVTKKGDKFEIEIKNTDPASKKFEGTAKGDVIEFTRDGKPATIKAATGDETGMKWLAGKKNCVVITKGSEGYCKD